MNLFRFFRGDKKKAAKDEFAEFLMNASDKEKKRVFAEAAQRANQDQLDVMRRAQAKSAS